MILVLQLIALFVCLTICIGFLVVTYDIVLKMWVDPEGFFMAGVIVVPVSVSLATVFGSLAFLCATAMISI